MHRKVEVPLKTRPSRPGSGTVAALAIVAATVSAALLWSFQPVAAPTPTPSPTGPRSPLVDIERVRTNALLAHAGVEPWASEVIALLTAADQALSCEGSVVSDVGVDARRAAGAIEATARCAYTLAVASIVGDPGRYLARAAQLEIALTSEDPCRIWSRGCGSDQSAEGRTLPLDVDTSLDVAGIELALAADLTRRSGGLASADADRLIAWLIRLSPDLSQPARSDRDLGVALAIALGRVAGNEAISNAAIEEWVRRLSLLHQGGRIIDDAGDQLLDLAAAQQALGERLLAVVLAGNSATRMLSTAGPEGIQIRDAVDELATGLGDPASWSEDLAPAPGAVWELAHTIWRTSDLGPLVAAYRALGVEDDPPFLWSTVVFGLADHRVATTTPPPTLPEPDPTATAIPASPATTAVGIPRVAFELGNIVAGAVPARITWEAATALPAGSLRYRVDMRQDAGRWHELGTTDRTGLVTRLPVGPTIQLRVRATSGSAASTSWVNGDPFAVEWIEAEEAVSLPAGAWKPAAYPAYTKRSLLYAQQNGATITFRFNGSAVALRGPVGPTRGAASIRVDGGRATQIDEFASRFSPAITLFVAHWNTAGPHEISIQVLDTPGRPTVGIDAVAVLQ